eukprot:CAMPEP_0114690296 /NCGR_PEP_ID=MMETSP0191-20121206/65541_1 /TAXON_ID=126664 /ORGANISM="Sorites sp." /LENGTH=85 /DNA_ID=CAMNT_0001980047 /DNA_START=332 /DNA_END=589 /DNA_ORIENTATION=+
MIIINASDYSNGDVYWPMEYVDGYSYEGEGDWGNYVLGKDGPCASDLKLGGMVPPWGYWCSPYPPRAEWYHHGDIGVHLILQEQK